MWIRCNIYRPKAHAKQTSRKGTLLSIPGHQRIAGNEEVDACAKPAAANNDGAPRPVSFAAASALIRRTLNDPPPCHGRTKEVYTKTFSCPADCRAVSTRRDAVLLARLRAMSKRCSTATTTIWQTIPTALGSYHQPGQRARVC